YTATQTLPCLSSNGASDACGDPNGNGNAAVDAEILWERAPNSGNGYIETGSAPSGFDSVCEKKRGAPLVKLVATVLKCSAIDLDDGDGTLDYDAAYHACVDPAVTKCEVAYAKAQASACAGIDNLFDPTEACSTGGWSARGTGDDLTSYF